MLTLIAFPMIVLGVFWAAKPEMLKNALTMRTHWKAFWLLAGTLLLPLLALGGTRGALGIVVALIVFALLVSALRRAVGGAFAKIPLVHFQTAAVFNIVLGLCMLRLK